jgi:hypothetical protein
MRRLFLSGFEEVARLRLGMGKAQPGLDAAGIPDLAGGDCVLRNLF